MKTLRLPFFLALICLIISCSKSDQQNPDDNNFATVYGGKPYKGSVVGVRSAGGTETHRWEGEGRIVFIEPKADSISMVMLADFGSVGEINLKLRGAYRGTGFFAENENIKLQIKDAKIAGNVTNAAQRMLFDGSLTPERSDLVLMVEFVQGQEGFPPGSKLEMTFDTSRKVDDDDNDGGCEMRLVPIWSPSGVTMGMVPDC